MKRIITYQVIYRNNPIFNPRNYKSNPFLDRMGVRNKIVWLDDTNFLAVIIF